MASYYPPGVTGNEPEIAGYPECDDEDCDMDCTCVGGTCTRLCLDCLRDLDADHRYELSKDNFD